MRLLKKAFVLCLIGTLVEMYLFSKIFLTGEDLEFV